MVKVKVISRNPDHYKRGSNQEIDRVPRNLDPSLHPFEAAREYTRALNAVKLEKVFAKPFLKSLDGHTDGVYCLRRCHSLLTSIISGSCDGQIKLWNIQTGNCTQTFNAHNGFVRGLAFNTEGSFLYSVGDDKVVKQWTLDSTEPKTTYVHSNMMIGIDHHWSEQKFATCGDKVDIWDVSRAAPTRTFDWGVDTIDSIKFNPVEQHILSATASDRSIILYDMRGANPLRKVVMKMRTNAVSWNPIEAFTFSAANEDSNVYTFDMRKLDTPVNVHIDHVGAVLSVDYSPTGEEFVTGSFDKTIRIFPRNRSKSREVYHTSRMQRVFCVCFSGDSKFVLSGSDETNIRLWKAKASERLGASNPRQRRAMKYNEKLKDQFQHHPEIKKIMKHRHLPKLVYKSGKEKKIMLDSIKRKDENVRLHSKPGTFEKVPERKKHVVRVQK